MPCFASRAVSCVAAPWAVSFAALFSVGCSNSGEAAYPYDAAAARLDGGALRLDARAADARVTDAAFWSGASDAPVAARVDAALVDARPATDAGEVPDASAEPDAGDVDAAVDRCANRATAEPVTLYLSADDSNSMAAPVIVRRILRGGGLPPAHVLRTYEFLNYYDVRYPSPELGHINVVPEMRVGDEPGEYVLQLGAQAAPRELAPQPRVVTLVLDTSGSMAGEPIALERAAVLALAANLRAGDIVSAVTWSTFRDVPLENHVVTGPSDPALAALAASLYPRGGTDLNAGLRFGYEIARSVYDPARLNRVVLISDGLANAGVTEIGVIDDASEDADRDGIYLVGVGVGDGVNDTLMDAVTDAGRGAYVYLDSAAEAQSVFGPRFSETMEVALLGVRLELTMPWYMAITEFHGEELSTVAEEVRPQHLSPGDAMVFHQIVEACEPSLRADEDAITVRVTYTRPTGRVAAEDSTATTFGELLASPHPHLDRGDAIVAYAEGLRAAASRGEAAVARMDLLRAIELADAVDPAGTDPAMEEIRELAGLAASRL